MVEFVSYDGKFPNLCRGELKLLVDKKEYVLNNILCSGGSVWFDDDWCEHVTEGFWTIDLSELPKELEQYIDEIEDVVYMNVECGCCGGCV